MKVEQLLEVAKKKPDFAHTMFYPFGTSVPEKKSATKAHRMLVYRDTDPKYDWRKGWWAVDYATRERKRKFFGDDRAAAIEFAHPETAEDLRAVRERDGWVLFGIPAVHPDETWEPKSEGTSKDFIKRIKSELTGQTGKWTLDTVVAGDMMDKHKQDAVTVELVVQVNPEEVQAVLDRAGVKNKYGSAHRLMIQTTFKLNPVDHKSGHMMMNKDGILQVWLLQAGMVVSIGHNFGKFQQGDLESFISSLKKATNQPLDKMILNLYKNGMDRYGRDG